MFVLAAWHQYPTSSYILLVVIILGKINALCVTANHYGASTAWENGKPLKTSGFGYKTFFLISKCKSRILGLHQGKIKIDLRHGCLPNAHAPCAEVFFAFWMSVP